MRRQALHQKKRAAYVGVEVPIPDLKRCVEQRPAIGRSRGIDQPVEAPELLESGIDQLTAVIRIGYIR